MYSSSKLKHPSFCFIRKTNKSLSTLTFCSDEIKKIIRNLDSNKAHGHDMLSIRMLKICDDSLCGPLELIFHSCIETGKFPSDWKKAKFVQFIKKVISKSSKITAQSLYFRYVVKYLNVFFIIRYFIFFKKII